METDKHLIDKILKREKERVSLMIDAYLDRQQKLPIGALSIREINNKKYCYLSYRDGHKVVSQYAGPEEKIEELKQQIRERKHIKQVLKMLQTEYKRIQKMEKIR